MFMRSKKRMCLEQYEAQLRRQTDAYDAWMNERESKEISGRTECDPLITVVPYETDRTIDLFDFSAMTGEFIAYVNGNGILDERALSTISDKLKHDLIYSDQDCVCRENNKRHTPFFKPDWSPDTLSAFFYFGDFFVVRKSLAQQVEVETVGDEISRLYDFARKYTGITNDILHLPQVLYHRYMSEEEAKNTDAFFMAGTLPQVLPEEESPLVSIIILSKDQFDILSLCTESIEIKSKYNKTEVIIVDNGSAEETREKSEVYALQKGYRYFYQPMEFNYSALCHMGAKHARGEYLLFLNDDIEVNDSLFIEKMIRYASMQHIGAVGAKLLYPNSDMIQHVGITNQDCGPSHKLATYSDNENYYFGRNKLNYNVLAVTGACMMISREKYFQVGGFSDKMSVSYNDVDLCVSLYEAGFFNVICNDTKLYHHESLARGEDKLDAGKIERLQRERNCFYERHAWLEQGDPFYNQNLIQDTLTFRPNIRYEYEDRNFLNDCRKMSRDSLPKQQEGIAQFNLERSEFTRGIQPEAEDYFYFEGWSILMKKDNAYFERSLLLIPPKGDVIEIAVSPKFREDVGKVFPDAKHSELAGFVCKVEAAQIDTGIAYQTAMLLKSKIGTQIYMIAGEQYEPKR